MTYMKSAFLLIAALIAAVTSFSGCAREGNVMTSAAEMDFDSLGPVVMSCLAAREADSVKKWGIVRADGAMLFSNRFVTAPSAVVNGYFTAKEAGGITVYKSGISPRPVSGLTGLSEAGVMSCGLMPIARKGKRIELVDGNGVTRIQLTSFDGREIVKTAPYFIDSVLAVCTHDGLWGAVGPSGEMVVEPVYRNEPRFSEKIAVVSRDVIVDVDSVTSRTDVRYYLINNAGKVVFTFPSALRPESGVHGGRMVIRSKSGRLAFLSVKGQLTELPAGVTSVDWFDGTYAIVRNKSGLSGLIDAEHEGLMSPIYKVLEYVGYNRFIVSEDGRSYALTDSVARPKVTLTGFDSVRVVSHPAAGIVSAFNLIGFGSAGEVLMNAAGRRLGAGPFAALSFRAALLTDDGYVHTGYFNVQSVVHTMVSKLTEAGWEHLAIGGPMPSVPDSVREKATETRSLHLGSETHYMLSLDAVAYSDRPVMLDSVGPDGVRHLYLNPDSRVVYIRAEGAVPGRRYAEMIHHLGGELVPMGFRAEKIREEYAVYRRGDRYVIACPRQGLEGMYLYVMDGPFYNSKGNDIILDGIKMYEQSAKKD